MSIHYMTWDCPQFMAVSIGKSMSKHEMEQRNRLYCQTKSTWILQMVCIIHELWNQLYIYACQTLQIPLNQDDTCKIHLCKISAGFRNAIIYAVSTKNCRFREKNARATSYENAHIQKNTSWSSGKTMYGGLKLWPTPVSRGNPR